VADVAVDLDERSRVEETLQALAGEQLALRSLPVDRLLRSLAERPVTKLAEPLELRLSRVA
jgi:hypothetical protein